LRIKLVTGLAMESDIIISRIISFLGLNLDSGLPH